MLLIQLIALNSVYYNQVLNSNIESAENLIRQLLTENEACNNQMLI